MNHETMNHEPIARDCRCTVDQRTSDQRTGDQRTGGQRSGSPRTWLAGLSAALLFAGLSCAGMPALADDTSSAPPPSGMHSEMHRMMKECMAKQKAANNGMSEKDMKKSCRDQMKSKMDHPEDTSPPVVPAH
jgi:hypothetical protein